MGTSNATGFEQMTITQKINLTLIIKDLVDTIWLPNLFILNSI